MSAQPPSTPPRGGRGEPATPPPQAGAVPPAPPEPPADPAPPAAPPVEQPDPEEAQVTAGLDLNNFLGAVRAEAERAEAAAMRVETAADRIAAITSGAPQPAATPAVPAQPGDPGEPATPATPATPPVPAGQPPAAPTTAGAQPPAAAAETAPGRVIAESPLGRLFSGRPPTVQP